MTKRTNASAPRDSGWINLDEPREVRYWTTALAVSEARLRSAVRAAGDATSAVRQYLGGQHGDGEGVRSEATAADALDQRSPRQMTAPTERSSSSGTRQQG